MHSKHREKFHGGEQSEVGRGGLTFCRSEQLPSPPESKGWRHFWGPHPVVHKHTQSSRLLLQRTLDATCVSHGTSEYCAQLFTPLTFFQSLPFLSTPLRIAPLRTAQLQAAEQGTQYEYELRNGERAEGQAGNLNP